MERCNVNLTSFAAICFYEPSEITGSVMCLLNFGCVKDLHDWKEPGSERPPSLPEKQAKARAILARTNAASLASHEPVGSCQSAPLFYWEYPFSWIYV